MNSHARSDLLELFPIKLVGGFIAIDAHAGCVGCSFCLSRRHTIWQKAFAANWHEPDLFANVEQALHILRQMKSFTRAHVPLRFGHNTDSLFQWDFASELFRKLPQENPCIILTRFLIPEKHLSLFQGQDNLLVKMTITPPSISLGVKTDVAALLSQISQLPPENLYVLIGPITSDNWQTVPEILEHLPAGLWMDIKPLTCEGIPGMDKIKRCDDRVIGTLRQLASEKGFQVTDFFGCLLRKRLKRPFYKAGGAPAYSLPVCRSCEQHELCFSERRKTPRYDILRQHAADVGLELGEISPIGHRAVRVECAQPTSRGDETYLCEMAGTRIHLSSVPCGSEGGTFDLTSEEVLTRWEANGLLPVGALRELALNAIQSWARHGCSK